MDNNGKDEIKTGKVKAVIFDLDGTLLDTLESLYKSVNYALGAYNLPHRSIAEVRTFIGNGVEKLMERAVCEPYISEIESDCEDLNNKFQEFDKKMQNPLSKENFDSCFLTFKKHYSKTMYTNTSPFEGIIPLLEELKKRGIKCAVVSNKFDDAVKILCKEQFGNLIDFAIGAKEDTPKKPSPHSVYQALKELKIARTNKHIVYVGDSEVDIETAKNAGLPCICVNWGYKDKEFLLSHGAKVIVNTPDELAQILILS